MSKETSVARAELAVTERTLEERGAATEAGGPPIAREVLVPLPQAASRDKITGSVNMTELLHSNENYDMKITAYYNLTMQI